MSNQNPLSLSALLKLAATADPFKIAAGLATTDPASMAKAVYNPVKEAVENIGPIFGQMGGIATPLEEIGAALAPSAVKAAKTVFTGPSLTSKDLYLIYNNKYDQLKGGMAEAFARVKAKVTAGKSLGEALGSEQYGQDLAELLGGSLKKVEEAAPAAPKASEVLPEWAKKLKGLAKPSPSVLVAAKKMKLSDLGSVVPEAEFTGRGWLGPDGELIDIGNDLHRDTILNATKGESANYPAIGGHRNLQRIASHNSFEILSPPTDAQLQQLAKFEKIFGPATWDITDPTTKGMVATGRGVRNIRAELETNPKASEWLKRFAALGAGTGVAAGALQEQEGPPEPKKPTIKLGPYASSHYAGQEEF